MLSPPSLSSCFEFSFSVCTQVLNENVRGLSRQLLNLRNFKENFKKFKFQKKKFKKLMIKKIESPKGNSIIRIRTRTVYKN